MHVVPADSADPRQTIAIHFLNDATIAPVTADTLRCVLSASLSSIGVTKAPSLYRAVAFLQACWFLVIYGVLETLNRNKNCASQARMEAFD